MGWWMACLYILFSKLHVLISKKKTKESYNNKKVVDEFGKFNPWACTICFYLSLTLLLALV
jgi:hypothetical protein